jgi:anti-sigma B factor antagonist
MAPGYAIVTPAGELDIATAPQLRECLLAFLPARPALVVDLNQVSFCDATGLGVLAGAANRARASGTSLHLVCSRTDIRRLFELTGLTRRLPLARTLDEVQAALTPAQAAPARNSRAARPGHRQAHRHPSGTTTGQGPSPAPGPALAPSRGDRHDRPA